MLVGLRGKERRGGGQDEREGDVEKEREGSTYPTFLFSPPTVITCSTSFTLFATNEERSCKPVSEALTLTGWPLELASHQSSHLHIDSSVRPLSQPQPSLVVLT